MQTYTVVGVWEDSWTSWVEYGKGNNIDEAIKDALSVLAKPDTILLIDATEVEHLTIVAVFPGRHGDILQDPVSASLVLTPKED